MQVAPIPRPGHRGSLRHVTLGHWNESGADRASRPAKEIAEGKHRPNPFLGLARQQQPAVGSVRQLSKCTVEAGRGGSAGSVHHSPQTEGMVLGRSKRQAGAKDQKAPNPSDTSLCHDGPRLSGKDPTGRAVGPQRRQESRCHLRHRRCQSRPQPRRLPHLAALSSLPL